MGEWLSRLLGLGDDSTEDSTEETDERACSVSGHDYSGQWRLYGHFARTVTFSKHKFKVYKKEIGSCRKCGKSDDRKETIGYVRVTDDDELEVVD